ncbi:hypothetical protein R6Q59_019419 [Mikania micrantha]
MERNPFNPFSLHILFGKNLERATRIVDERGVKKISGEPSGRSVFQVIGGESTRKEEYLCFPQHYCACYSFFYDVVNRGQQLCVIPIPSQKLINHFNSFIILNFISLSVNINWLPDLLIPWVHVWILKCLMTSLHICLQNSNTQRWPKEDIHS